MPNDEKICPLMSGFSIESVKNSYGNEICKETRERFIKCQKEKCALWGDIYSSNGDYLQGCALQVGVGTGMFRFRKRQ